MRDAALEWLAENDVEYKRLGADTYGARYGIDTPPRRNRRRKFEDSLSPDFIVAKQDGFDHCQACRRRRVVASHTVV